MSKMLKNSFASKGGSTSSQKSAVAQNSSIRGRHTTFPNPPAPHATKVPASLTKSELLNSHAIKDKIPEVGGVGQGNRLVVIQTSTKKSKAAPTEKSVRSSSAISYKNTCPPEYQGHWRSGNEIQTTTSGGVDYGEILGSTSDITAATIMFKGEGNNGHGRTKRIYTDWANHYLEKVRSKRHIQDLQVDVTDGVILADVIEAVANLKIPEINRKPKTSSQMLDNIQACLVFLTNLGVSLEGINSHDIRDGHLKSILSLFFQLSRFKQQQKQQDRDRHNLQRHNGDFNNASSSSMMQASGIRNPSSVAKDVSKLPSSSFGLKPHQTTSIPLPSSHGQSSSPYAPPPQQPHSSNAPATSSALSNGKKPSGGEKGKAVPLTVQHHHIYSNPAGSVPVVAKPASGSSSRSSSPSGGGGGLAHSFIPTPRSSSSIPSAPSSCRSSLHEKHLNNAKNSSIAGPSPSTSNKSSSSVRQSSVTSASIHSSNLTSASSNGSPGGGVNGKNNSSMLEKFKFFKDKDKSEKLKTSTGSKRTSSSSGFSSARSERSDSSVSLCSDSKTGEGSADGRGVIYHEREKDHFGGYNGSIIPQSSVVGPSGDSSASTPRLAIKGFRQKIGKAINSNSKESKNHHSHHQSPKSSRKDGEVNSGPSGASSSGKGFPNRQQRTSSSSAESQQPEKHVSSGGGGGGGKEGRGKLSGESGGSVPTNGGQGFLRQPKPSSSNSRDNRNRFSGTGIPTRNSLIVTNNSSASNSRDELLHPYHHSSNGLDSAGSNNSVHSSMSSINGGSLLGSNNTGIPKPTAAVKGTSKQQSQSNIKEEKLLSTSLSREALKDCPTLGNASLTRNRRGMGESSNDTNSATPSLEQAESTNKSSPASAADLKPGPASTAPSFSKAKGNVSEAGGGGMTTKKEDDKPQMESGISTTKPIDPSITIAMVAPMQSLSTSTSVSSVDSSSQSLSQSQMSSHSNSSEASVILAKGLQHQLLQQKQNIANSPMKNGANSTATGLASSNATSSMTIAQTHSVSAATNNKSEGRELIITDESGPSTKVSPMSVFGGSGSSSMGSLNKCALESSSGASSAGDLGSSGELRSGSSGASSNRPSVGGLSPNNGNNEAIPECDEDDLLLNVTPMEPMTYEYIKSPPSGHQTPGFLSPKSSSGVSGGGIHLGRIGPCNNGNGRILNRPFNPYGDPVRLMRTDGGGGGGGNVKYGNRQYAASVGENEYSEIDNYDINAGGYLSDGDLLMSGSNGNRSSNNDGYLSESGYSRRHQANYKNEVTSSGNKSSFHRINQNNNNKHGLIPEDSFDDSSSISSGISDLNEIPTDLTSSSVNSELSSPYASLQRGGGDGESISSAAAAANKLVCEEIHKQLDPQSIIYRVVGSRNRRSGSKSPADARVYQAAKSNEESGGISLSGSSQIKSSGGHPDQQSSSSSRGVKYHGSTNTTGNVSSSSPLGSGANNGIQSVVYSLSQQHLSSGPSSHKRSLNSLDLKAAKNKGMIGLKEDYYGREMGERLIKEERDRQDHSYRIGPPSSPSVDEKRSHSAKMGQSFGAGSANQQQNPNFGYVRRSTGCGIGSSGSGLNGGGGHSSSVSNTKYSIPVYGNNGKMSLSGMKEMLTPEEFKAAHAALAIATGGPTAAHHPSPYAVITATIGQPSPKTRTKVKVSGGTQTPNDIHEMSSSGRHSSLGYPGQHHHYYAGSGGPNSQQNPESEYGSVASSRNSGSYSSSRYDPTNGSGGGGGGGSGAAYKSLSLTTPTASQLSQSLRERILGSQSLPKGATAADYAALLAAIQAQNQQIYGTPNASKDRMSRYLSCKTMNDGSLSDTGGYSNYSEIQAYALSSPAVTGPPNNNGTGPYPWMRHSTGYASSITSAPTRLMGGAGSMTEAESMESLSSSASLVQHNLRGEVQAARSHTLSQARTNCGQTAAASPSQSPRLNRSNSIRSTKSEKLYPSMLQRHEEAVAAQYYNSVMGGSGESPMSHVSNSGRLCGNLGDGYSSSSPGQNVRLSMSPYTSTTGFLGKISTKEDETNASSLSLVSTSSMYSSQEDKQAHEVRKLRRDLVEAQEKVQTLTNQLSTNAHVVAAFEQSLSNMTQRIQSLTCSAEQKVRRKDTELLELRQTIELLRKQSIEAGLTVASMNTGLSRDGSPIARQLSADSVSSINSISSACSCTSHSHSHTSSPSGQVTTTPLGTPTHGPSGANHHSNGSIPPDSPNLKKKHGKNKGWLRSSFTKAFSRSKSKRNGSVLDEEGFMEIDGTRQPSDLNEDSSVGHHHHHHNHPHSSSHLHHNGHSSSSHKPQCSKLHQNIHQLQDTPGSPLLSPPQSNGCSSSSGSRSPRSNSGTNASSGVCEDFGDENKSVDELKKQLREKEMVLTDIRLEALTSAHQLESLKETVNKMRNEMLNLKQDNERLQRMVTCKSLTSSQSSLQMVTTSDTIDRRLSASEIPPPSASNLDILLCEASSDMEGKRIVVTVFIGCHGSYERYINSHEGFPAPECNIGTVCVSNKTKWDVLDAGIKRAFKEYLGRVDPISNVGLSADSILSYNVGEVLRSKEGPQPELLPCGYLVGDVTKIRVCLKGASSAGCLDALAFETLVPKSILQRYITLLSDHGRIILCGPSGTGKSYLARKIGEYLVARCGKDPCPEAIATFSADHKNSKELRQYLANLADQCESGSAELPSVIILDNLHQVSSFGEVFSGYLNSKQSGGPVIIGTMTQSTASTPNLQLHHNFRWVLFGNHMEPVKGLLSRYLQRRLVDTDVQNGAKNLELSRVMDWIPKVWLHINKFLETHNSSEVTIGPRLFLSCPTDVANSQVWFTDLWHYSIVPYIMEAVKEGLQLYGKKSSWEDPCYYLLQTYPWTESHSMSSGKSSLLRLRPEDVGYDTKSEINSPGKTPKGESNGDQQDPLMNMLMRLQEAANYSGPQSNESDNRSMDRTSLDKDYIATA
ncbi:protein sickie isoform X4 [Folsomia candida]|uniref:protein sickie isoform X4 n=1 Tax=Folsomia candida TaxID=158441 RepID=UPI001604E2C9|nr:protein sickie isoform X4 [Folsomia candida]